MNAMRDPSARTEQLRQLDKGERVPVGTVRVGNGRFRYHQIVELEFRRRGEACMTESAGQRRVPEHFVRDSRIPVPPLPCRHAA